MKEKTLENISINELSANDKNANLVFDRLLVGANDKQREEINFLRKCYNVAEITSNTDELTGLGNRRALGKKFREEYSRMNRSGNRFAVVGLDIDYFKKFNDTYGHEVGDDVLKQFSDVISENIRTADGFYRHGGEEFYLVMPLNSKRDAHKAVSKLRKKIQETPVPVGQGKTARITFSSGAYLVNENDSMQDALKNADMTLYKAKESGRNQVRIHYENKK